MQQTSTQAYLIIQLGNRWTDVLRLQKEPVFIGRSSENHIVVRDERVSRQHARISPREGRWVVEDLGSRNGTQVGDTSITEAHVLRDGETIGVGGCRITFSFSLNGGFAASRMAGPPAAESIGGQATRELGEVPTIVNRRSQSQWSSEASPDAVLASADPARAETRWNFFYRLVFDLVTCQSRELAAQVALERLLEQLGIASGGVVAFESSSVKNNALGLDRHETLGFAPTRALPMLTVLAARQPAGGSYRRVSDFLVETTLRDRQAVLARNVMDDSKLSLAQESARRGIISIICAPLRVQEQVIGLLHVYSAGDERMLTDVDLDLAVGVADNLAIALSMQQANEQLSQSLEKSRRRVDQLQQQLEISTEMVGSSAALENVKQEIRRVAPSQATVLIRGESGVGKELVARAIHGLSSRSDGPLVCLNCAALAPTLLESELFGHEKGAFTGATDRKIGKFEAADGGTLLLDEVGEMPSELQAKFLRVLEGHPFERLGGTKAIKADVRVIAATNRNLEEAVQSKEFRSDLYYRLRVVEIVVPPLRTRLEDVPPLVEFFLNQFRLHAGRRLLGIEPAALAFLSRHSWPGNIRELRNVIERAVVLGTQQTLGIDDLSISSLGAPPQASQTERQQPAEPNSEVGFEPVSLAELERRHIAAMLNYTQGNKTKASQLLGIERSTLDRKLKRSEG